MMINVLCWVSTLVVLVHVIGIAGKIGSIHRGRRAVIAAQWSLITTGAVAIALGLDSGGVMVLGGIAIRTVADQMRKRRIVLRSTRQ